MATKTTSQKAVVAVRVTVEEREDFERIARALRRATGDPTSVSDVIRRAIAAGINTAREVGQ